MAKELTAGTVNAAAKATIEYKGKKREVTVLGPGIAQASPVTFYIQDCVTKTWTKAGIERYVKLRAKYGFDFSKYKGAQTKINEKAAKYQDIMDQQFKAVVVKG